MVLSVRESCWLLNASLWLVVGDGNCAGGSRVVGGWCLVVGGGW